MNKSKLKSNFITASLFCLGFALACSSESQRAETDIPVDDNLDDDDDADDDDDNADDDDDGDDDDDDADDSDDDPDNGDPDDEQKEGCQGIDFVVVVDNSGSMADEQENLAASFPKFLTSLQDALADTAQDFHVMVVDTDADPFCSAICAATPTGTCFSPSLGIIQCDEVNAKCEFGLGAGRVRDGAGKVCGITGEQRYIISGRETNVAPIFECLGTQGTSGDGAEKPMEAMTTALSEAMLTGDGCNAGFLRNDAITVIMVITDEEDDHPTDGENPDGSAGDPQDWFDAVMRIRPEAEKSVMAVGLIGDTDLKDPVCEPFDENMMAGAEGSPRLREFFEMFGDKGAIGSVCEADYSPFLNDLIAKINESCEDFTPPPE
jgi:hypothetical protein